jgi:HK97 family phage portal protein
MSWINKLLGIEKIQKKAMSFPGVYVGAPISFFKWDRDQNAYDNNDTVYTVVKKIGRKAATVPIYSYLPKNQTTLKRYKHSPLNNVQRYQLDRAKALDEVVSNSALSKLINNPNPTQGADAFFEGVFSFYALNGETFIWLNRGGIEDGEVLEMYLIPPDKVELVPDPNDLYGVLGYILDINGKLISIPKSDIIHWKTFNPNFDVVDRSHLRGFNPMRPLKRRLQQDNDAMEAAVAMFQNGGAKGVLTNETLDNLTPEQAGQLKSVIDNKINNTAMKAAVATLQGKWEFLNIGKDSVDMQLLDSQDKTMERIAMALGVDPDILVPGQSFSNKEWAQKKFVTDLIMPMCNSLRDELNRVLVPSFGGREYLDYDFSTLPELQDDYSKMSVVYNAMFDRGAITGNEYRQLLGFEVTTEQMHNKYLITGNYGLIEDVDVPEEDLSNDNNSEYNDYMAP